MQISEIIEKLQEIQDMCGEDIEALIEVCDEHTGEYSIIPIGEVSCSDRDGYGLSVLFLI